MQQQLFGVMSAKPIERTTINDLNRTTLVRYRDYMLRANPAAPYNNLTEADFLERLQITDGERLTYAGLLFMGKNLSINKTFSDFRVDLLEIPGGSYAEAEPRYTFRLEEQENLWEYYFAIIARLRRQVPNIPYRLDENGVGIEDSLEFNAIREALVNLLIHCDYFSLMKPRVRVFTNRIEFENPGAFPRPIEELKKIDLSLPRNPVLAKLFRSVKLADNAGYGIDKMLKWEVKTHTNIEFETNIDYSVLKFYIPETEEIVDNSTPQVTPQVTPQATPQATPQVQDLVTALDGYMNTTEIRKKLGLLDREYFRLNCLKPALELGYIATEFANPKHPKQRYYVTEKGLQIKVTKETVYNNTPQVTPQVTPQATPQVTPQVQDLVTVLDGYMNTKEIREKLGLSDREYFRLNYLKPALELGYIATEFANPNHPKQRYYLTEKGMQVKAIALNTHSTTPT
jgi:predicted HTH transcriptional regulator